MVMMNNQQYPSLLLQKAVNEMSRLPGIGSKTALRLVLHMLRQDVVEIDTLAQSITELRHGCSICSSPNRDRSMVCVVENIQDVMAIENTQQYKGLYHVLGGIISPMDGIGPADLEIQSLVERVEAGGIDEVILALSPTMEGDTTNFYIYRKIRDTGVRVTVIARGVAQNDELQYTDELTLGRALVGRTLFG